MRSGQRQCSAPIQPTREAEGCVPRTYRAAVELCGRLVRWVSGWLGGRTVDGKFISYGLPLSQDGCPALSRDRDRDKQNTERLNPERHATTSGPGETTNLRGIFCDHIDRRAPRRTALFDDEIRVCRCRGGGGRGHRRTEETNKKIGGLGGTGQPGDFE